MSELAATAVQHPKHQWQVNNKTWRPFSGDVTGELKPGLYELVVDMTMFGKDIYLKEMKVETDKILALPGSLCEYVVNSITKFWDSKPLYASMGLIHKRGIILEGDPGTGKTAILLLVGQEIAKAGGVALFSAPTTDITAQPFMLSTIRKHHAELPIVNMIEDLDRHLPAPNNPNDIYDNRKTNARSIMLAMLDGEQQVPNVLHLATTNYINKIDHTFTDRPSRFDEVIKVKPPVRITRLAYMKSLLPPSVSASTLAELVAASKGMNFAHMKELAISHVVYGRAINKAAARLKALSQHQSMDFDETEYAEEDL